MPQKMKTIHVYKRLQLHAELCGILSRMRNDVEPYIELMSKPAPDGRSSGFWGCARLLMPVIEAVSKLYYQQEKGGSAAILFLKRQLGYTTPKLIWQIFRHGLMHNDIPPTIRYGTKVINWQLSFREPTISLKKMKGVLEINLNDLYNKLYNFLLEETTKNNTKKVSVEHEIHFVFPTKELKQEFQLLN